MKHWQGALAICVSIAGCRYGYELLPVPAGQSGAGTGGAGSLAGSASSGEGGTDASVGGSAGDAAGGDPGGGEGGTALAGSSGAGGSAASGGTGGSGGTGDGGPPNMALCDQGTYGGHDYLLCEELRTWGDASEGCLAVGMRLVRVDDADEDEWLFMNANTPQGSTSEVWLGATDQAVEGEWRWSDGDLFWVGDQAGTAQDALFAGWYFREPNNVDTENCAVLDTKSVEPEWYDYSCELVMPYVCESP